MITEAQRQGFAQFQLDYLQRMTRPMPAEMWHYTSGQGLMGILQSGELYFTHIGCLNDSKEYRYFGDLVLEEVKRRHAQNQDAELEPLYAVCLELLTTSRDFNTVGLFVSCFSEKSDDLGQWRGYGGGECGYAIVFEPVRLAQAIWSNRQGTFCLPMNYAVNQHFGLVHHLVDEATKVFREGLPSAPDPRLWATELVVEFSQQVPLFSAMIKHPAFASEEERRLSTMLLAGEHKSLVFHQRKTLLSRSLPVSAKEASGLLPIMKVVVGPGPAQSVTKISVGDLLVKYGYSTVPVEESRVPYRIP